MIFNVLLLFLIYNIDVSQRNEFTNIRSLLEALAKTLNLINPEVENHHKQTAYFSFFIAQQLGFEQEDLHRIVYSALLHDVGSIIMEERLSIEQIESEAEKYARIGAEMLKDLDDFTEIAEIIENCQTSYQKLLINKDINNSNIRLAAIIHLADFVSTCLDPDTRILNQVKGICDNALKYSGTEFMPEAVEALLQIKDNEVIWLDAMFNPSFLMFFTGEFHKISLERTASLTRLMSRIIDYRSSFTAMHSAGVAASARILAQLCGMNEEDCLKMEIAGNLHDIGKLVVPRSILEKNGKLTDEEYNIIKEHPYYTRLILMNIENFDQIANWAGFHHEKLNGKGYPFHIDPASLDKGSRIMAVADIFSAITEDRPYRTGMPKEKVIAILNEDVERGDIDPEIVRILIDNYELVDSERGRMSKIAGKRYYDSTK